MAIDPECNWLCLELPEEKYEIILSAYAPLISAVRPYLEMITNLGLINDYIFELIAYNGASLIQNGNFSLHGVVAAKSIFDEKTMGTNAHTLCMRHNKPIQVMGAEHYCSALTNLAASAAPIRNKDNAVIASLLLTQPLPETPWSPEYHKLTSYTLGLLASISAAVENQLRFAQYYDRFKDVQEQFNDLVLSSSQIRHILDTAIDTSSDNIVVIYPDGSIAGVNLNASHLLRASTEELVGLPIKKIIGLNWPDDMFDYLNSPSEKNVLINSRPFRLVASPITNKNTHELESILIKLHDINDSLQTKRSSIGDAADITFADILGPSQALKDAIRLAQRFSTTSENILIVGESGTGKEYFAQAIHNASRPGGPFMSINCAAIPPRLIESELFGYEAGSFTGADRHGRMGKIELANNGTLFLDEIGDMPLELQATLLRVLENRRVMRLGGKNYKQVNFKIIAATNRNLPEMIAGGAFREDLFYRLSVLTLELLPLRLRRDDLEFFIQYFLADAQRKDDSDRRSLSDTALEAIRAYPWPGNVRQLRNAIVSACHAATSEVISISDLPPYLRADVPNSLVATTRVDRAAGDAGTSTTDSAMAAAGAGAGPGIRPTSETDNRKVSKPLSLSELEKDNIGAALEKTGDSVSKAASLLGISKATLYRKIREYGLRP
jgi:transcriptional regulator with PAS, ATPase and Fis domain